MGSTACPREEVPPLTEFPLSEFWRKNTSYSEPLELANLLRALRKVAGHLGPNAGTVEYAGMSQGVSGAIVLDPTLAMGAYPVPSGTVDRLVGLVTHEALHRIEWSDHVWKVLEPSFQRMDGRSLVRFQKIVHTGEDIYVDRVVAGSMLGLYTNLVRREAWAEARSRLDRRRVSVDGLVLLWWEAAWADAPTMSAEPPESEYREPASVMAELTVRLVEMAQGRSGRVTDRCQLRADLFEAAWSRLADRITCWPVIDPRLHWFVSGASPGRKAAEGVRQGDRGSGALPLRLTREINLRLAEHSPDITPIIQAVVGYETEEVVPTSRWDFHILARPVIDRRLVARLEALLASYGARRAVTSRGLLSGILDRRRLYRSPFSGRCFFRKDRIPSLDWSVTLLMDASGSMRGNKWRLAENAAASLHKALIGYRNTLRAFAYFEVDGVCMISQLVQGKRLLSVPPTGRTASGQAIIAAAHFTPRDRRQRLLIHVTDGESNLGCDVSYGIEYCRRQGIHLVTLGCGTKSRDLMLRQYGRSIQFLDHFGQLPQALERLLRWAFLYGGDRHPGRRQAGYRPSASRERSAASWAYSHLDSC